MSVNLKYDARGSNLSPSDTMKVLGIDYEAIEHSSIFDWCIFYNCKNIPESLPKFLEVYDQEKHFDGDYHVSRDFM